MSGFILMQKSKKQVYKRNLSGASKSNHFASHKGARKKLTGRVLPAKDLGDQIQEHLGDLNPTP